MFRPSLKKLSWYILILFLTVSALLFISLLWLLNYNSEMTRKEQEAFIQYQVEKIDNDFQKLNSFLHNTVINSENVKSALKRPDTVEFHYALRNIQKELAQESNLFDTGYSFAFYLLGDLSVISHGNSTSYQEDETVRQLLLEKINAGEFQKNQYCWRYLTTDSSSFFIQVFQNHDAYILAWIKCEQLFSFFLSNSAYKNPVLNIGNTKTEASFIPEMEMIDTTLEFCFDPQVNYHRMILFFVIYIGIILSFICVYIYTILYYRKNIVEPLEEFKKGALDLSASAPMTTGKGFAELHDFNNAIAALRTQLENLKIDYYENKLALSKTELDYYQIQIKPHFFINCVNIIFSMIQKKELEKAEDFCIELSSYIRYLYTDTLSLVTVSSELKHLNTYLNIQNIRYRTNLSVSGDISPEAESAGIPPLLFVTFIENSIKYAGKSGTELSIDTFVSKVEKNNCYRLMIQIQDNGVGFNNSYLEKFRQQTATNNTISSDSTNNIGIFNIWNRLCLLFHEDFTFTIENRNGAYIHIELPFINQV